MVNVGGIQINVIFGALKYVLQEGVLRTKDRENGHLPRNFLYYGYLKLIKYSLRGLWDNDYLIFKESPRVLARK